jgi:DNA gyrase subunit A
MNVTDKTGKLVTILDVTDEEDLMIITKGGITIRMEVTALRVIGRATQGVKLIRLNEGDKISSIAKVPKNEEEASEAEGAEGTTTEGAETTPPVSEE